MPNITSTLALDLLGLDATSNLPINLLSSVSSDFNSSIYLTATIATAFQQLVWLPGIGTNSQTAQVLYFRNLGPNNMGLFLNYVGNAIPPFEYNLGPGGVFILFGTPLPSNPSLPDLPPLGFVSGTAKSLTSPSVLEYYLAG